MAEKRSILIVGGGTAGWLTAAYLARFLALGRNPHLDIAVLESPEIGTIGVGEGAFPTIRATLQFLGIDEARFVRATTATFKQGIRFNDWLHAPHDGGRHSYLHPFEAPLYADGAGLVPYWLLQDEATRPPFAEAVTIQNRVAEGRRGPKRLGEEAFGGPLSYAYHFDAHRLGEVLAERAVELGVRHIADTFDAVALTADGQIDHVATRAHGRLTADLFVDCTGLRAGLIGGALGEPLHSVREHLFVDRAVACKVPYARPDAPLESVTIATAHEAGWTWDIGLAGARGIGTVYSSMHLSDDRASDILQAYVGRDVPIEPRILSFEPGYRARSWIGNCVAVGLAAGFLEPLESTGLVLIEAAVAMIAELFPHNGPIDGPSARYNRLMSGRFETIVNFLKLHYCLSQRPESFWRDHADPTSIPPALAELLAQWRYRPPNRFDFTLDLESFAFFNYQYILYGMRFRTELARGRDEYPLGEEAERLFARIRAFGEHAVADLPLHRALIDEFVRAART
ncbi:tryptophan halogenase family protein [Sphingomonas nostoxanthinifaciens]|uniref:tryptophan halogenase family protein n=1 Tax=Sphingomonas nostoxanthinifaciens TaxID=2872652 RepID=UPI001CC1CC2A|nr:tryptophan halogenase family protein [Sphingomonas nostoxanthinifaciens]UAK25225.1 tryptophan 7-halogenase [Sphingomonas nostoxanthinifaciens]